LGEGENRFYIREAGKTQGMAKNQWGELAFPKVRPHQDAVRRGRDGDPEAMGHWGRGGGGRRGERIGQKVCGPEPFLGGRPSSTIRFYGAGSPDQNPPRGRLPEKTGPPAHRRRGKKGKKKKAQGHPPLRGFFHWGVFWPHRWGWRAFLSGHR